MKEGTSATLMQSGLNEAWWSDAIECFCFLKDVIDPTADGKTSYEKRFGVKFSGPLYPFGCEITYKPSSPVSNSRCIHWDRMSCRVYFSVTSSEWGATGVVISTWSIRKILIKQKMLETFPSAQSKLRGLRQRGTRAISVSRWLLALCGSR